MLRVLKIAALLAASAGPVAGQTVPCSGTYAVQMGAVVMPGGAIGRGPENMGTAQVDVHSCGRGFTLDLGGTLDFAQDIFDDQTYAGGFTGGDGATRTYTLTLAGSEGFVGGLVASDGAMTVTRSITLSAIAVTAPDLSECQQDTRAEGQPDRNTSLSEAALQDAMAARGLAPPGPSGLGYGDYTRGSGHSGAEEQRASVLLSDDGAFLPRLPIDAVADQLVAICDVPEAEYVPARFMMDVKVFRFDGGANVFLRVIDIQTSRIIEQREAVVNGEDQAAIGLGIGQAWDALTWSTGTMSTGRTSN